MTVESQILTVQAHRENDSGAVIAISQRRDGASIQNASRLADSHHKHKPMPASCAEAETSESSLQQVFDEIPALVWCNLADGTCDFCNKSWHDYTGISSEEALGCGWQSPFHPDDLPRLIQTWAALAETRQAGQFEARLRRHDGAYRWFVNKVEPSQDASGNVVRWFGTSTDINDFKTTEVLTRHAEEVIRRIADVIPQTIVVLNPDGTVIYANKTVLDYTGLSLDDIRAEDFHTRAFHPEDVERVRREHLGGQPPTALFENELRVLGKDGKYRWFFIRCTPLTDETGNIVRWYANGTDIEERKRAEERPSHQSVVAHKDLPSPAMFEEIVGASRALHKVLGYIAKVAPTDATVLIRGETGTGKELVARAIHARSKRADRAFVRVNCAAIPPSLITSELFGHEKGAFTGALQRRLGRFEAADGGTLFLDEIGDLPPETQIALLRVLQEHEFERIGGNHPISVDVRIVAATNRDLDLAMDEGLFRSDLFYRLSVFPIHLPALRDRVGDIPLLLEHMVKRCANKVGKNIRSIRQDTLEEFQRYRWPGNVRELQNIVERGVICCEGECFYIDSTWLTPAGGAHSRSAAGRLSDHAAREKSIIEETLRQTAGRISGHSGAAARLGLPRQTLESKIRKLGIERHRFQL